MITQNAGFPNVRFIHLYKMLLQLHAALNHVINKVRIQTIASYLFSNGFLASYKKTRCLPFNCYVLAFKLVIKCFQATATIKALLSGLLTDRHLLDTF